MTQRITKNEVTAVLYENDVQATVEVRKNGKLLSHQSFDEYHKAQAKALYEACAAMLEAGSEGSK